MKEQLHKIDCTNDGGSKQAELTMYLFGPLCQPASQNKFWGPVCLAMSVWFMVTGQLCQLNGTVSDNVRVYVGFYVQCKRTDTALIVANHRLEDLTSECLKNRF